ncbi:MAG: hypothetical protein R2706_08185 [Acidimicrobiales bacterium]
MRFVGEPVAVVISSTYTEGVDAAELVFVDYEPLEAVVATNDAAKGEVLLFPEAGTNQVFEKPSRQADDFFACDVTVDLSSVISAWPRARSNHEQPLPSGAPPPTVAPT